MTCFEMPKHDFFSQYSFAMHFKRTPKHTLSCVLIDTKKLNEAKLFKFEQRNL